MAKKSKIQIEMEKKLYQLERQLDDIISGMEADQLKFHEVEAKVTLLKELLNS